jgi:hypothetical protein
MTRFGVFACFAVVMMACPSNNDSPGEAADSGTPSPKDSGAGDCPVTPPTSYASDAFAQNAADEIGLLSKLNALSAPMRAAELDAGVGVDAGVLNELYSAGKPSLKDLTVPQFQPVLNEALELFVDGTQKRWTPMSSGEGPGGIFGSGTSAWIFSSRGVDVRQVIDKGLYGALFYAEAVKRMRTVASASDVDKILALYGATPAFPQNDTSAAGKDELSAKYAKRRNAPAAPGFYTLIRDRFIEARAYAAVPECSSQRTAALKAIAEDWEKTLLATVIFYINSAATKLQDPNATESVRASALHDLGEGAGFVFGLRAMPAESRRMTDAQLDAVLAALQAPSLKSAALHRLLTDIPPNVEALLAAVPLIAQVYGFSAAQVEGFKISH